MAIFLNNNPISGILSYGNRWTTKPKIQVKLNQTKTTKSTTISAKKKISIAFLKCYKTGKYYGTFI